MENLDKITEKIQKLLNKSESAREIGNLEEAEAFAQKVNELLIQYNLTVHDLKGNEPKDNIDTNYIDLEFGKTEGDWVIKLYNCIAKFNLCRVISIKGTSKIMLIGDPYNQEIVVYTCVHLKHTIKSLRAKRYKEYFGPEKKNTYYRAYSQGAVNGIWDKLQAQKYEMERQNNNITALVVTNDALLDTKVKEIFGETKSAKSRKLSGADGGSQGYVDGRNMNINKGIKGSNNAQTKLN